VAELPLDRKLGKVLELISYAPSAAPPPIDSIGGKWQWKLK